MGKISAKNSPFYSNQFDGVTFSIGTETGGNVISVTVTVQGVDKLNLGAKTVFDCWLSDSATTLAYNASAPSGGVAAGSNTVVNAIVAGKRFEVVTHTNGVAVIAITEATAKTFYLVVKFPDGTVKVSPAITFAS